MTHYAVPRTNRANARKMRKQLTEAELRLWNELRAHRLMGLAFRRQMPISGYIVDFACASKKLIIELDGSQHGEAENASADRIRTAKLEALGWTVLRFWNDDVVRDIHNVCRHIVIASGLMAEDARVRPKQFRKGRCRHDRPHGLRCLELGKVEGVL